MASVCLGNQFTVVSGKLTVYKMQGTGYNIPLRYPAACRLRHAPTLKLRRKRKLQRRSTAGRFIQAFT
jgi:hypothetical protein